MIKIPISDNIHTFVLKHILYHYLVFWSVCVVFHSLDFVLYLLGRWNRYKLQPYRKPPISKVKIVSLVLFNQVFITLPMAYLFYLLGWNTNHDYTWAIILQKFIVCLLLEEVFFYYGHRMLHLDFFYQRIHKIHHIWIAPTAISTFYVHPFEHFLSNILPLFLSAWIVDLPFYYVQVFMHVATVNAVIAHAGYAYLVTGPRENYLQLHDAHHLYRKYNYGVLGILDYFHSTLLLDKTHLPEKVKI